MARKQARAIPRGARTERDILALKRTVAETRDHWMLVHPTHVTIAAQRAGEVHTAWIEIPRRTFDRFVDFYNGVTRPAPKRAKRVRIRREG